MIQVTFLLLIPYNDLAADRAQVHVEPIAAATDSEAKQQAVQLLRDARGLMDLLVEDWRDCSEFPCLDATAMLAEHGIHLGDLEIWQGSRLVWCDPATPSPSPLLGGAP